MFAVFARAVTRLNRLIGRVAAWVVLLLFALLMADVITRYLVGRPLSWTSELAQLTFGVYAIIAGGFLLAERGHVNVDIFYGRFSRKGKARVDLATSVLFFAFVIVLLWQSWDMAADSLSRLERSNSAWKPYIWPVKLAIPIAAMLLLAQGVVRFVADVRVLMDLPVPDDVYGAPAREGDHA